MRSNFISQWRHCVILNFSYTGPGGRNAPQPASAFIGRPRTLLIKAFFPPRPCLRLSLILLNRTLPGYFPLLESYQYNTFPSNKNTCSISKCPSSSPIKTCQTHGCADTRINTCSRSRLEGLPRLNCGAPRISKISTRPIQPPRRASYGTIPWLGIKIDDDE